MNKRSQQVDIITCQSFGEIRKHIANVLSSYKEILPVNKKASILIKPNLNSNMNALTGNTTDLRLLAAVLLFFKEEGYTDITIGEGTNSGFYRSNISVITRLKVDQLARYYGVKCIDLNYSEAVPIPFENGIQAGIAKECIEADFFINMPKLKTHFEAGMTVCLKNLIGCLVGQENKKKTHNALADNIVNLTENCPPHLHIVDALFAMEGLGPTKGTPIKTDTIFVGTDPYLIDLMAARFASYEVQKIYPLVAATKKGIISKKHTECAQNQQMEVFSRPFAPPKAGLIATFIHHPKRQKYFLAIRNTSLFSFLCNTEIVGKILFMTDLRQDVFLDTEMECHSLSIVEEECTQCGKCRDYCPLDLRIPDIFFEKNQVDSKHGSPCIQCLYCFCVCPEEAIKFHGTLGFMEEQMMQYDVLIRNQA